MSALVLCYLMLTSLPPSNPRLFPDEGSLFLCSVESGEHCRFPCERRGQLCHQFLHPTKPDDGTVDAVVGDMWLLQRADGAVPPEDTRSNGRRSGENRAKGCSLYRYPHFGAQATQRDARRRCCSARAEYRAEHPSQEARALTTRMTNKFLGR